MRRRSLRGIALAYVGAILIALVAVRGANDVVVHRALQSEVDRRLLLESQEIAHAGTVDAIAATIERKQDDHENADLYFALFDRAGRKVGGALALPRVPALGYSDFDERAGIPGVGHGRVFSRRVANGATLSVVSGKDTIDQYDAVMSRVQLIGFSLTMLIVIGGTAGMIWEISRRLRSMQQTVDAVMAGDFTSRVPQTGKGAEFDRQAAAFNAMLDRIGTLMNDIRHGATDVAHELKSPLARLRNRLAAIDRRAVDHPLAPEIGEALGEADQMIDLFASLMRLWEIEGGHRRERFEALDLAVLASEAVETLRPVAEDARHDLTLIRAVSVMIDGERNLLRQLLVNLIENAVRHTTPDTPIAVSVTASEHEAILLVSDRGPGIPADQRAHVVRRFGRLDQTGRVPGHGIGLTLVDAIVRLHHGTMVLEDAAPGLRIVIALPRSA